MKKKEKHKKVFGNKSYTSCMVVKTKQNFIKVKVNGTL